MLLCSTCGLNVSAVSMYFARGQACDKRFACPVMVLSGREYEGVTMGFPKLQATDVHYGSPGALAMSSDRIVAILGSTSYKKNYLLWTVNTWM